ncbi:TPA: hypothetical protein U2M37_003749 [Providencia stuartii]|nr:hypothetical protein [Providencia stuartii]MBG5916754.1 hypothetical protein [Providencia stuartii]HEM6854146.1 hypothetical protein [Providencia stuartii]HEM8170389.1 hypothetical protein [Providencia stuartii]HEM8195412.1 hypothetical protein [Providencia stuartii]
MPASSTVIGFNATVKSALLPPLIVQVVSVIAPLKLITPPAAFSAASAGVAERINAVATDKQICYSFSSPRKAVYMLIKEEWQSLRLLLFIEIESHPQPV